VKILIYRVGIGGVLNNIIINKINILKSFVVLKRFTIFKGNKKPAATTAGKIQSLKF